MPWRIRVLTCSNPWSATQSQQFALAAATFNGRQHSSKTLRMVGFLACVIGLPLPEVAGDMNGLRSGTPELVHWAVEEKHCSEPARLIGAAWCPV